MPGNPVGMERWGARLCFRPCHQVTFVTGRKEVSLQASEGGCLSEKQLPQPEERQHFGSCL